MASDIYYHYYFPPFFIDVLLLKLSRMSICRKWRWWWTKSSFFFFFFVWSYNETSCWLGLGFSSCLFIHTYPCTTQTCTQKKSTFWKLLEWRGRGRGKTRRQRRNREVENNFFSTLDVYRVLFLLLFLFLLENNILPMNKIVTSLIYFSLELV